MALASTCKAVSGSVEERTLLHLLDQTWQTSNICKRKSIYTPHFLSAPLAQLALPPMPSLPVTTNPTSKQAKKTRPTLCKTMEM